MAALHSPWLLISLFILPCHCLAYYIAQCRRMTCFKTRKVEEIPAARKSYKARTSFTADSPYYTSFCELEMRQVTILSETLKEISARAKTFGKCGAIMAESTRRLSSACRLETQSPPNNSDDEGDVQAKTERDFKDQQERKQAIGKDMSNVLQLLAEVRLVSRFSRNRSSYYNTSKTLYSILTHFLFHYHLLGVG